MDMSFLQNSYTQGILIGTIVSGLVYIFTKSIPWLRNIVSKEAQLEKTWNWYDSTCADPIGTMEISRVGCNIKGTLIREKSTAGEKVNRKFPFNGKIYGGQLIFIYEEKDNPKLIIGSVVLKLRSNRKFMYGRSLFLDHDGNEIISPKFIFSINDHLPEAGREYLPTPLSVQDPVSAAKI